MKSAADLFAKLPAPKVTKQRNRRDELIDQFLERINPGRIRGGYKPYSPKELLGKISRSGRNTKADDLYIFYQECSKANHFSRFFHWAVKRKI